MKTIVSIALLFVQLTAGAQIAKLVLDTNKIRIGEQIKMRLSFEYNNPDGKAVLIWPEYDDILEKGIEIVSKSIDKERLLDSATHRFLRQQDLTLTIFEEGEYTIFPQEIALNDSTYLTDTTMILVETVAVDTSKGPIDIKPIYAVDYPFSEYSKDWLMENWIWIAIILGLILAFFIYRYIQKQRQNRSVEEVKEIIPAHIIALNILDKLLKDEAWKSSDKKTYYSELTGTVRSYLENRFDIHAMEKTTREIISDLKNATISDDDKAYLRKILREADMVKFAKFAPNDDDAFTYLQNSIDFVKRTKEAENKPHGN